MIMCRCTYQPIHTADVWRRCGRWFANVDGMEGENDRIFARIELWAAKSPEEGMDG